MHAFDSDAVARDADRVDHVVDQEPVLQQDRLPSDREAQVERVAVAAVETGEQLAQLALMTGNRIEYFTDTRPPKVPPFVFLAGGRKRQRGFRPEQPVAIDEYRWKYDRPRPDAALLPLEDPPT